MNKFENNYHNGNIVNVAKTLVKETSLNEGNEIHNVAKLRRAIELHNLFHFFFACMRQMNLTLKQ